MSSTEQKFFQPILYTLNYFDIFDYPLTFVELKKYLFDPYQNFGDNPNDLANTLNYLQNKKVIQSKSGYYFLKGRKQILKKRLAKHLLAQKLWKRAYFISKIISRVPFVRMIAVCNTLALNNISPQSDIDFFIIIENRHIWTTRFLITLVVSLLGLRRHKKRIAQKICLSFYITPKAMDLKNLALNFTEQASVQMPDIYLIYWLASLSTLFSEKSTQKKFFQENLWIKEYLPNFYPYQGVLYRRKVKLNQFPRKIKIILENLLNRNLGQNLENYFKKIQLKKMSKNSYSQAKKLDTAVIISDDILKFHEIDRREKYREDFLKRIKNLVV